LTLARSWVTITFEGETTDGSRTVFTPAAIPGIAITAAQGVRAVVVITSG
jgi:hypothetical protein